MFHLDELTLPVAQQLALDESLLLHADQDGSESFRLWELSRPAVIIGRGSRWREEVDLGACRKRNVPILRRCSGGAAIVGGPGCLFYSLVLNLTRRPALRDIEKTHKFVLSRLNLALSNCGLSSQHAGTSDIAVMTNDGLRKVSGNSLRLRRNCLLYHGTLLNSVDLDAVGALLRTPPRQPDYRAGRSHADFVTNLSLTRSELRQAVIDVWMPLVTKEKWPQAETIALASSKYETEEWNYRL